MLNRKPPGKEENCLLCIEGQTKNMTPEGIMDFIMGSGLKGTDTNIGKAPKTKKTKPKCRSCATTVRRSKTNVFRF